MTCRNKGRAVLSSLKIKCKDCNFFGRFNTDTSWERIRNNPSWTKSLGWTQAWGGNGMYFSFCKEACVKKKKYIFTAWLCLPTKRNVKLCQFLRVEENFYLSDLILLCRLLESNGYSFRILIHVSFSMFKLNYLFSKSLFSAVFPPTHSQRE